MNANLPSSARQGGDDEAGFAASLAALDQVLAAGAASAAAGAAVAGAFKRVWGLVREKAESINLQEGGRRAGEHLAACADLLLGRLLAYALKQQNAGGEAQGVALLATGSFARRDPAPYSDLDLLILYDAPFSSEAGGRLEKLAGALLCPLWDAGLQVGHAARTAEECLAAMLDPQDRQSALGTATGLLEARFVAGDEAPAKRFLDERLRDFFRAHGRPFVEAKAAEAERRHHRQGDSVFRTQPDLKDSPGGLRDYQLAIWIDRASRLSGHLPRLAERPLISREAIAAAERGYERLLTIRAALHAVRGRKEEVLDYSVQPAVAEALGYEGTPELQPGELLLRDYFQSATAVYRLAGTVIRRYQEEQAAAKGDLESLRRRPVDQDFTRLGDYLHLARPGAMEGEDWLEKALRGALHAARLGAKMSQELILAIRERLPGLDEAARRAAGPAALFRELLQRRGPIAPILRTLRDLGLLGAYLPEFGQIEGLVISDAFHDFTVDEHTLFAIEYLDGAASRAENGPAGLRREVLGRLADLELLRLAVLLHDLGKSRGGPGHSRRGAEMVPAVAERLGLGETETRTLMFLVEHHLLLSRAGFRRDTGDEELLADLARKIGAGERLDLLYLLTCADAASVGQASLAHWKDEVLAELYHALAARLEGRSAGPKELDLEEQLRAAAADEAERNEVREHCACAPRRYLVEVNLEEARLHLRMLRSLREQKREAVSAVGAISDGGRLADLWVVSSDRPRRFAQLCGAFLGLGVNLVSAAAFTRKDGLIIDRFLASPGSGLGPFADGGAGHWSEVAAELERVLDGPATDFRGKLESARRRLPRAPEAVRSIRPEVRVDNALSTEQTVVDVICGDRIGLAYALARAIGDMGCDIHFAKLDTQQGLVTNVYYVTEVGGVKIQDPEKQENLKLLLRAIAADFQTARR